MGVVKCQGILEACLPLSTGLGHWVGERSLINFRQCQDEVEEDKRDRSPTSYTISNLPIDE
jgi:hypothetical protein